jgi:hypothetical protein
MNDAMLYRITPREPWERAQAQAVDFAPSAGGSFVMPPGAPVLAGE